MVEARSLEARSGACLQQQLSAAGTTRVGRLEWLGTSGLVRSQRSPLHMSHWDREFLSLCWLVKWLSWSKFSWCTSETVSACDFHPSVKEKLLLHLTCRSRVGVEFATRMLNPAVPTSGKPS